MKTKTRNLAWSSGAGRVRISKLVTFADGVLTVSSFFAGCVENASHDTKESQS